MIGLTTSYVLHIDSILHFPLDLWQHDLLQGQRLVSLHCWLRFYFLNNLLQSLRVHSMWLHIPRYHQQSVFVIALHLLEGLMVGLRQIAIRCDVVLDATLRVVVLL